MFELFKVLAAAAAMLGFIGIDGKITTHFANRPKNSPQANAVLLANDAEFEWYKKPGDPEAQKRFKVLVVEGSAKDQQVTNQVEKARKNNSRLLESSKHKVKILEVKVDGEFTTVVTKETSHLRWSSGKSWTQKNNLHTYRLRLVEGRWRITADEFEF